MKQGIIKLGDISLAGALFTYLLVGDTWVGNISCQ